MLDALVMENPAMKIIPAYTVKVGDLARRLDLAPIDLIRLCDIAVNTAYRAYRNEQIKLETCYKIYAGLKAAGYDIRWEDVVQID